MVFSHKTLLALIFTASLAGCVQSTQINEPEKNAQDNFPSTSNAEISAIMDEKIDLLQNIAEDPIIIDAAILSSEASRSLSSSELERIESGWENSTAENSDLISGLLTNDVALALVRVEENFPGFTEIFVTDKNGVVFASTIKTEDYLQSDEEWWQRCFSEGSGEAFYSELSFDTSASSEGMAIHVPIMHNGQSIGCIKAFFGVTSLYQEILTMF